MVLFNYSTRELTAKIVYYGPGLCGKTTNLQYVHANLPESVRGKMLSLATKTDRTLFFDFLPIDLGDIRGMKTRVQLYTVPGQVFYNETRKLVLKGADGIVFVADSQEAMLGANVESFRNLEDNLKAHGMRLQDMPHVIQFNKRDLPRLSNIEDLNGAINKYNAPFYESVATTGIGVQDTLKAVVKLVLLHLTRKYEPEPRAAAATQARAPEEPPARAVPVAAAPPQISARPGPAVATFPAGSQDPGAGRSRDVRSVPVSSFATPLERLPEGGVAERGPAPAPPLPPVARGAGARSARRSRMEFGEEEIDRLVDEVEETEGVAAAPAAADDFDWTAPIERVAAPGALGDEIPAARAEEAPIEERRTVEEAPRGDDSEDPAWEAASSLPEAPEPGGGSGPASMEWSLARSLDEIAESRPASRPAPDDSGAAFEVDLGFDPSFAEEPGPAETLTTGVADPDLLEPLEPQTLPGAGLAESVAAPSDDSHDEEPSDVPVVLRDVARPEDLFEDPSLEVARLQAGEAREIVVPVEIGRPPAVQRFRLSVSLRLDRVD